MYIHNIYDHAMCMHFHHPLNMTFLICLQLLLTMTPIDTINCAIKLPLYIYKSLVFHYIATYNIISLNKLVRP